MTPAHEFDTENGLLLSGGGPKAGHNPPKGPTSKSPTEGAPVRKALPPAKAQAQFLHKTLLAIGTEMEESRRLPPGARLSKHTQSARHRDELKRAFELHTSAECAQLRRTVAAREAEVAALRQQVNQTDRLVQATRLAATRRSMRLRRGLDTSGLTSAIAVTQGLLRSKARLMQVADVAVYDAEDGSRRTAAQKQKTHTKELPAEDTFQAQVASQVELEKKLRSAVEAQFKAFNEQTIQRKAREASLFGTQAETLKLRSRALRMESRVSKLANDLRRVYKQVPDMIAEKLKQGQSAWVQGAAKELEGLQSEHLLEHFKWSKAEDLREQITNCQNTMDRLREESAFLRQVLEEGKTIFEKALVSAKAGNAALESLRDSWSLVAAHSSIGGLVTPKDAALADSVHHRVEEALMLMQTVLMSLKQTLKEPERLYEASQEEQSADPTEQRSGSVSSSALDPSDLRRSPMIPDDLPSGASRPVSSASVLSRRRPPEPGPAGSPDLEAAMAMAAPPSPTSPSTRTGVRDRSESCASHLARGRPTNPSPALSLGLSESRQPSKGSSDSPIRCSVSSAPAPELMPLLAASRPASAASVGAKVINRSPLSTSIFPNIRGARSHTSTVEVLPPLISEGDLLLGDNELIESAEPLEAADVLHGSLQVGALLSAASAEEVMAVDTAMSFPRFSGWGQSDMGHHTSGALSDCVSSSAAVHYADNVANVTSVTAAVLQSRPPETIQLSDVEQDLPAAGNTANRVGDEGHRPSSFLEAVSPRSLLTDGRAPSSFAPTEDGEVFPATE